VTADAHPSPRVAATEAGPGSAATAGAAGAGNSAVIALEHLTVRYGARTALDDVNLIVPGGAVGLLGPNGAGKSTLLKTLLGLLVPASGGGRVLGLDIGRDTARLRRRIGYMPERDALFPGLTGFQATLYAGRLAGMPDADARRRSHEVLLFAGLHEARYRDVSTYSTGMKQRVKLAQALVHDPDLVLLDEPTNGLDPRGRQEMLDLIAVLSRDKGIHVLLSSHLLADVEQVCSAVIVVQGGRVVRHEELRTLAATTPDLCIVRITGEAEPFLAACRERGLGAERRKDRENRETLQKQLD